MKISIITCVYNNKDTIKDAIESVLNQTYNDIEYIIIDGNSNDGTIEVVRSYGNRIDKFITEEDDGIYDAMNKGISLSTGDIVGILNSDDFYIDDKVIEEVVKEFDKSGCDSVYADLIYVNPDNLEKTVRYYNSSYFNPSRFAYGWMPAHPTFFLKKKIYNKYGFFKTDYKIAADYELLVRLLGKNKVSYTYINKPIVKMRIGGVSTSGIKSNHILNKEIIRACKENEVYTNWAMILSKYPRKILELFKK